MFYGFVVTEAGNRILAQMVSGQTLRLSRVVMEKGTAESAEAARKLTAPLNPGPEGTTTTPTVAGSASNMIVEYRSDLNGGLAEGFWIGGFGVYAENPEGGEDVMLYYGSLGDAKQYVSAYTPGTAPDVRRYPVSITVTEGVEVVTVYPAEAWMTAQDVAAYFHQDLKPELLEETKDLVQQQTAGFLEMISIGDEEPGQGPVLWFNTAPTGNNVAATLRLGETGGDSTVAVEVEEIDYPIRNAVLNEPPTEGAYSFTIV